MRVHMMSGDDMLGLRDPKKWSAPVRLARDIANSIIDQELPVGTHLGSLPDVAGRYGVSVPTLRKATTYLLDDGFVVAREGRGGGLVVASPPGQTAVRAIHLFFSGHGITLDEVDEVRQLVGSSVVDRACRLVEARDEAVFEGLFEQGRAKESDLRAMVLAFDAAIVSAAREPVLALVTDVLDRLDGDARNEGEPDLRVELDIRRRTAEAILGGSLGDAIALHRQQRPVARAGDDGDPRNSRLPDQAAAAIRDLVASRHLGPGDEIGLERALQEELGVGRDSLRDALRLLERSGAIKINQGRGGGIFVGSAEPYEAIEMATLYLSSIKLTFQEQIDSRQILEARAAWLAAERITPELRVQLSDAMAADAGAARHDVEGWRTKGATVEHVIARACGNPLLEFFTLALIDLSLAQARKQGFDLALNPAELARAVSDHHQVIVEAILDGNRAGAAFRTRQYIRELGSWVR